MRSPLRNFDHNLRSCGWHGHVTYRPGEELLAERLQGRHRRQGTLRERRRPRRPAATA